MRIKFSSTLFALSVIYVIAFAIRLYQLSFFEYHYDQFFAIALGNNARTAHFLITHGMSSGTGLDNPPFFPYIMGILTAFSNDPVQLTFYFFCINILALTIAIIYFYYTLPSQYSILSAAYLALFPAFTIYSNNIWAQCLLPLIVILFNISFYKLIKYEIWQNFFYMGLLIAIGAQIHGAGFMLYPILIIIAIRYWNKIDKKVILLTLIVTLILFVPYIIHLFKERTILQVTAYGFSAKRPFQYAWKIIPMQYRMASFEFFRSYFKFDFNQILRIIAGKGGGILYIVTFIPGALFVIGFLSYIKWLMKGKLFDKLEGGLKEYPLPFQISGFMILIVTLGFLLLRVSASLHYCIVLFPAYSILTGFFAFRIWKFYWGKFIVMLGIISTVVLLIGTLLFIDKAGGHPYEYGISYKTLISWQKKIQASKNPGECFDLKVNLINKDTGDVPAISSVLNMNNICKSGDKVVPAEIKINWNDKLMCYEYQLSLK